MAKYGFFSPQAKKAGWETAFYTTAGGMEVETTYVLEDDPYGVGYNWRDKKNLGQLKAFVRQGQPRNPRLNRRRI